MERHDRFTGRKTSPALRVVTRFDAEAARVFHAWLDPGIARQWLFATASHPIDYAGRYSEVVPSRRLVFTLMLPEADRPATRVTVNIRAAKLGATLELIHENVPASLAPRVKARWTGMLYGLRLLLGSGRGRLESFDDRSCRFEALPIDYKAGVPRSTTI